MKKRLKLLVLSGAVNGLRGDVSGLRGDVSDCELTVKERAKGINIRDLVGENQD